jgi:hypothetical protein
MKTRLLTLFFTALPVLAAFVACGGSSSGDGDGDDDTGTGGKGGTATGGSAGKSSGGSGGSTSGANGGGTTSKGGSAGSSPSGGDAGTAPTGGTGGTGPTGGAGGTAGSATGGTSGAGGGGVECETADDCAMFSDCCSCEAAPKGSDPAVCDLLCIQDQCSAQQIERDEVTCSFGRCVIDRSCDHSQATCDSLPEPCSGGLVRALNDSGCWGPCLPPTECREVTDCSSCADGDVCVIEQPQISRYGCVRPDASCTKGNYCECLDPCPASHFVCVEGDDAVQCPCPAC